MAVLLFLVINIISARVRVDGISMRPTLEDGEFVLINRLAYKFGNYQRGDIIVFRPPMYPQQGFLPAACLVCRMSAMITKITSSVSSVFRATR